MSAWQANEYGPTISRWLADRPAMPLGAGRVSAAMQSQRRDVTVGKAFVPGSVKNIEMANAVLAGLWLGHNDLETSHRISQAIETPTGSYWHAIMHRREGDFSNSKYWFRKAGAHPVEATLRERAAELARDSPSHPTMLFLQGQSRWDAFAFVDLVEQCVRGRSPCTDLAAAIQRCEWELLMDFCYRAAVHP